LPALNPEISQVIGKCQHEEPCKLVRTQILNIRIGNIPYDIFILIKQIKDAQGYFTKIVIKQVSCPSSCSTVYNPG
jgi:hypothetical protein